MGQGMMVALLAASFLVFACGALMQRSWARWLGTSLATINLLLALSVVVTRRYAGARADLGYRTGGDARVFVVGAGAPGT